MSGGSQHNPNGRQAQLGAGWSPLQLQVANFLARAPQAHMAAAAAAAAAAERGVTWHTPTPPPHLYHVPAPSPPDPLQAMKTSGNSVFRHTATPPELYRHTPTPPDKHLMRHTPSPGDVKAGAALPPAELYPHLGTTRDKLVRGEELLAYARGVDLSVSAARSANGAGAGVGAAHSGGSPVPPAHPSPALSVRDAPTINSLIARAQPRPGHARVDALLERLSAPASASASAPAPASPHSVIVHSRAQPTPSPPSSNEDSADSCGAPPGSKRKRKPERTVRMPAPPPASPAASPAARADPAPIENGDANHTRNGPQDKHNEPSDKPLTPPLKLEKPPLPNPKPPTPPPDPQKPSSPAPDPPKPPSPKTSPKKVPNPSPPRDSSRRKLRSNSSETIDDIAAMVASDIPVETTTAVIEPDAPVSIDKLKSVLASPGKSDRTETAEEVKKSPPKSEENKQEMVESAAAPKRRSTRTSNSESTNVPVESPSEAKPAEPEAMEARSAEPTAASFVEVENQLEKMFAGLEEPPRDANDSEDREASKPKKRRKSAPTKGETKAGRRANRASTIDGRRKAGKKKNAGKMKMKKKESMKDAYDSGSNASSSRSRGPYIQIRGPCDSPLSVSVMNAAQGEEEGDLTTRRKTADEFRNGLRAKGLHASTLGLRYDASTPDATWLCVFCLGGPHHAALGDLFGPYSAQRDCDGPAGPAGVPEEVWFHEACAVWAPGLVAAGARVWGLAAAVGAARGARCAHCARAGAPLACRQRHCRARAHLPCARAARWLLDEEHFAAACPRHA